MTNRASLFAGFLLSFALTACSTISTKTATLDQKPEGVRIYAPKVWLLVDQDAKKSTIAFLPDYKRAYDIKPVTVFAKQDFKVELDEGQLKTLTSNQDSTAFLTFLKEAAQLAAKAAGLPTAQTVINGTFGLGTGIYQLTDEGNLKRVTVAQ